MSGEDACKAGNDDEIARAGRAKTARRRPVWSMRGRQCAGRAAQSSCVWMYAHAFCTRSSQAGMGVSDGVEVACVRVRCSLMMSLMAGPCVCSGRCTFYRTDWRLRTNALLGEGVQSACGVMRGEPQPRVRARRAQRREARTLTQKTGTSLTLVSLYALLVLRPQTAPPVVTCYGIRPLYHALYSRLSRLYRLPQCRPNNALQAPRPTCKGSYYLARPFVPSSSKLKHLELTQLLLCW